MINHVKKGGLAPHRTFDNKIQEVPGIFTI